MSLLVQLLPSGFTRHLPLAGRLFSGVVGGRRWLVFGVLLLGPPCLAQSASLADPASRSELPVRPAVLTLTGGVGAPYGCGLDYGRRVAKNLEATVGAGYDLSGFKAGVGARYYLFWDEKTRFATFFGANVNYCAGRESVTLTTHEDQLYFRDETAQIRIQPCAVGRLRAGLYWQPGARLGVTTALGHGLVLGADPVQYLSTALPSDGMKAVVATRRPDSLELSLAVSMRLGK